MGERLLPGSQATAAQEQALVTLCELVEGFIDEKDKKNIGRIPLMPCGSATPERCWKKLYR